MVRIRAGGHDEVQGRTMEGAYLYCLSSSMTWTPWSYCSAAGSSPTAAKWPFMMGVGSWRRTGFEKQDRFRNGLWPCLLAGSGWKKKSATEVGQRGQSLKLDEVVRACSEWHAGPVPQQPTARVSSWPVLGR